MDLDSKSRKRHHSKSGTGESGAPSTTSNDIHRKARPSQPLVAFVNTNSLPAGFTIPELLPFEERDRLKRRFIPKWSLPPCEEDYFFDSTVFPTMKMPEDFSLNEFPDDVLVEVFRRLHQTDRIHSVSLVCRRWNRLLCTVGLWKSVRINIRTEEQFIAAKDFLKREHVSHSLVKLEILYSEAFENLSAGAVLPEKLPKLLHYHSVSEIVHKDGGIEFLEAAMPVLQTLILKSLKFRKGNIVESSPFSLSCATSKCLFKTLEKLSLERSTFNIFPLKWREHVKEVEVSKKWTERRDPKYGAPERLRIKDFSFWNPVLQTLSISCIKLVALDISSRCCDLSSVPQFIAAVRNLHVLEHLHMFANAPRFPVAGLFAPPQKKFDFPSRLKYLSVSYLDPIVVEEVTQNCPELRSLYLNAFDCCCVISESTFTQIADRLRNLEYLRVNCVSSSIASMLNALEEDALPRLRYLHSGIIMQDIPPRDYCHLTGSRLVLEDEYLRNLTPSEMADVESLLSKRPNLTVVSGRLSSTTWFVNGEAYESPDRLLLHRLLGSEEGACCFLLFEFDQRQ